MDISILEKFSDDLEAKFARLGAASPEDQLKQPVADLVKNAGDAVGLSVESRTEVHLPEHKVRPDVAILVGGLICGYIELKAPGFGADAPKLKGKHNKAQWNKLKGLPNLIYTDGREWALYRSGERKGSIVRFDDDPTERGRKAVTRENAVALGALILDFLGWDPIVPHQPRRLAEYLAPLTRFLRTEVEAALDDPESAASLLKSEWQQHFFPEADDGQFADAYAQTIAYALLLARLSGADDLDPAAAAATLDRNNGVLALALERLGQREARDELRIGFELLQRSLKVLDPHDFLKSNPEIWLYFYEDFLAAYDPKLRKDYGVYYTPRAVVELQVRLISEILDTRFGKTAGFADEGVVFLDPAVGTGTYPVAAVKHGLSRVRDRYGEGAVPARAAQMARNMHGFEILIGPYAVAHVRLTQALESEGAVLGERLNIYLADTLGSPNIAPPGRLTLTYKALTQEHQAARKVKAEGEILVCLGNPPYDRQQIEEGDEATQRKGGWVRFGDRGQAKMDLPTAQVEGGDVKERPILLDFSEPASQAGAGVHVKNLYNDYVYFWRWALWRLFEQQNCGGIVSFITASSYLAGPGFIGMREMMRRTFDDLWIIDLGGDNLGTRKTPNVFSIRTPVAIAIGVRGNNSQCDIPANVRYVRIESDSREAKLRQLDAITDFSSVNFLDCSNDWHAPFVPERNGKFMEWPKLLDIFPYQRSGSKFGRPWPIAETSEVIQVRWQHLLSKTGKDRETYFRNNKFRKIEKRYKDHNTGRYLPTISSLDASTQCPNISRYTYRFLDRQWAIEDIRFNDRMGEVLWRLQSESQLYFFSLMTEVLGQGSAMGVSSDIPDLHVFCGRGGKDIMPLFLDIEGSEPNITIGLLDTLSDTLCREVEAGDLAAYIYSILGGQSYTRRFWNELETPGARVPITKDGALFTEAATLGRRLVWLHTYAERFRGDGRRSTIPAGRARCITPVSDDPALYPEDFEWIEAEQVIRVGTGRFGPVSAEVWNFEVSGLMVVQSWLGYRKKKRAGKKSSPLDDIRPERWTARMTEELLELLWVLEETLAMEPDLEGILDRVVAGPCFKVSELPQPTPEQRRPPRTQDASDDLFEATDEENEDGE
ncbi:MAG: N-6 DNA methylase [Rhodospirillaceae bacterium]|nr:N-6 DNA methylase [Rhodospirillaceae bacterium]MYB14342.1 N-6 DNA methylase [Rhodospirillaceae bacterium]MYI50630.1 N-6 DNA methylase [Rhodospirillaceae bacterium]